MTAPFDVDRLRQDFPALASGLAFFDGPGGTQTPKQVGEAIASTLTGPLSNRGSDSLSQRNANDAVLAFRAAMADLLDADQRGIVHGRSATTLTYDISRALAKEWREGDEVIVTRLDHDANVRPWVQAAQAVGAVVRWAEFDPATAELGVESIAALLSPRTKLVAVTAASNLLGTMPDVRAITVAAHEVGALVYVDGVHAAAHRLLSVRELGADLLVCSPYKFLGPHCGVLAAAPELLERLRPDKLLPASNTVPERFEHGTLPYEVLAGVTAAVDYLAAMADFSGEARVAGDTRDAGEVGGELGRGPRRARLLASFTALEAHETRLRRRLEQGVADMPGVRAWSRANRRTPTLLFTFEGRPAVDISRQLLSAGVLAPSGNFYALEASRHLGLDDRGGLRIGLAPYSDDADVDRLLTALAAS